MRPFNIVISALLFASTAANALVSVLDVSFDGQTFDPISGIVTTESDYIAFNGATSAPSTFNTFTGHTSASIIESGITVEMTNILGSWSGNNSTAVTSNPLRADYFIVQTGQTATLSFSGLDANSVYDITFTHGNAEPTQHRWLDILGVGTTEDINNLNGGVAEATFSFVSDSLGELSVDMTGGGVQEGNLAGFRIVGGTVVIPEPSTYGLMLLGMLVLGFAARKRHYQST